MERLPKNYLGHDTTSIIQSLIQRNGVEEQGEYEKSDQYRKRLEAVDAMPLVGKIRTDGLLALKGSTGAFEYDPDNEIVTLAVPLSEVDQSVDEAALDYEKYGAVNHPNRSLELSKYTRTRQYVGRNVFGVLRKVFEFDYFYNKLSIGNWTKFPHNFERDDNSALILSTLYPRRFIFSFSADIPTSKRIRNNRAILYLCRLINPPNLRIVNDYSQSEIRYPAFGNTKTYYLEVDLIEAWIYDAETGFVYRKIVDSVTAKGAEMERLRLAKADDLKILAQPRPIYTQTARENNVAGTVVLSVTFLDSGQIGTVEVVSGLADGLTEKAIDAAKRIKFKPAMKSGKPITVTRQIEYKFDIY